MPTTNELKIAAYDLIVIISTAQRQLQAIEIELQKHNKEIVSELSSEKVPE